MVPSLRRRKLLAGVAAAVSVTLAGCEGHGPSLELRATSDSELLVEAVRSVPSETTADRFRPIVETIENGTYERHSLSPHPPVEPAKPVIASVVGPPIEYEGSYYTLPLTERVERTLTEAELRISAAETASDDAANAVEYDALPAVDGTRLDGELPPETGDREFDSVHLLYDDQAADESVIVPELEADAIVRDGKRYPIEVADVTEQRGYTYRYEAERVASTDDEFLRWLRSNYRYELTDLPGGEREIVDEAIEEHRYAGSGSDDAFVSLSERFLAEPALDREDGFGEWLVRYDGDEYVAELDAPPAFH